jgi:hypothetical protein
MALSMTTLRTARLRVKTSSTMTRSVTIKKRLINLILRVLMSVVILSVAINRFECRYAECCGAMEGALHRKAPPVLTNM